MTASPPSTPDQGSAPQAGLIVRAVHSSAFTILGFGAAQALRFGANIVLARLLFPEAFGLMALVSVFLVALIMFSDTGIGQSVRQSPRGDEPDFLNTAWTIQILRGGVLWALTCALAWPAANFYSAPDLMWLLPVAGLSLLLSGIMPMRFETAHRHLLQGRVTLVELAAQLIGTIAMIALAWATGSVWALVAGGITTALTKLGLALVWLPGEPDRLRWEPRAARELYRFGLWIFVSSAFGFLLAQGDKAILGRYLSLEALGLYNIAWFLASFPMLLAGAVVGKVLIPLYRDARVDPAAARRVRQLRHVLSAGTLALLALMALAGPAIVTLLYDSRYSAAAPLVVLVALAQLPTLVGLTYDQAALAAGDSRGFFRVIALRAIAQTAAFLTGVELGGLEGALVGQALAATLLHPAIVWLARRHKVWDPAHDLGYGLAALGLALLAWT